ncbi:type II toxin-antitoxin system VapC family toxin [Sphingobacterium olei]|uniref:type II toxin-antitoxin system VapC family toxin n=1 Tax=Sphingobacterium olei TaxID=2571155 RepID=UPI00192E4B8C|nr:type II toxin-antitoxin system VapC family toxin [Sphingobacterium olei]
MVGNLLDTHVFLWYLSGDESISNTARKTIEKSPENNFISIASLWEVAIKISLGKLVLHRSFSELEELLTTNGFHVLPIEFADTLLVTQLPFHHRDPFDRIIIAQSINNKLKLISKDGHFAHYNVKTIW